MSLADQIREIPFDTPAPAVAERLGCREEYVRAVRARARRPDHYRALLNKSERNRYWSNPDYRARKRVYDRNRYYRKKAERLSAEAAE